MTDTLLTRREKVLRTWLTAVNPVVDVTLDDANVLTFANAAERASVATPADSYVVRWSRFDNAAGSATAAGEPIETAATKANAPASLVAGVRTGEIIQVTIVARHPQYPAWAAPVTVHFRRAAARWELVGLRRLPQ